MNTKLPEQHTPYLPDQDPGTTPISMETESFDEEDQEEEMNPGKLAQLRQAGYGTIWF